jgi:ubiquitin-activating enzyme E1
MNFPVIPAIATTTALVTGLVCMEIYKLIENKELEAYRNSTINLALPLFQAAEPIPPKYSTVQLKTGEWKWSLWDRIDVDLGDVTLQTFVDHLQEKYGLEVNMLSYGASLLYSNFTAPKKAAERLKTKITELVKNIGKHEIRSDEKYLVLEPSVTNIETDEDLEIPYVRYKFR